mgnify:CR=1 FL=1
MTPMSTTRPLEVLVTEPIMTRFADVLTRDGTSPHAWHLASGPGAARHAAEAEVLVCSSATPELLATMPRLRMLHVTGAGTDKIAMDALGPDVAVATTSHHGPSIAEHVMMVSMMLLRGVRGSDARMREGRWQNAIVDQTYPFGTLLSGRTLGLVGLGEIGGSVARLAQAMGMRVRAVRRSPDAPPPEGVELDWSGPTEALHELLGASDVVVVTVPLTEATRGSIDAAALAAMRPDAVLVNVARGPVVDEQALHEALSEGRIGGAGLDVWWRNPRDPDTPPPSHLDFTGLDNVVLTPHQSGHTWETFGGRAQDITDNVDALADGRELRGVVRAPAGR